MTGRKKEMSLKTKLSDLFKSSKIFNFNVVDRDAWVAKQAKNIAPGSRVLDSGAGSCPYRPLFAHCEYKAQDFVSLKGKQLSGGEYGDIDYVCDIKEIPVPDQSFDVIVCTEVLEHLPRPDLAIQEFSRILVPRGTLILTAPLGSGIHQEPYHYFGGFTPFWYKETLQKAGFGEIVVDANGGTLKAFSQESLRFVLMTQPLRLRIPAPAKLAWSPIWLLLLPILGIGIPIICHYLDRFDEDQRFTIGYHVKCVKVDGAC